MAEISDEIFREYDIRGIFGKDLLPETAALIAEAYAVYIKDKGVYKDGFKVSIGRDVRTSSDAIRDALARGLNQSGISVIDVGVCPTPLQYFSMHTLKVDGGFMITGSHNPPEYNGFKVSVGNETIHGKEIQRLKKIIKAGLKDAPTSATGGVEKAGIITGYIDYVAANIKLAAIKKPLKLVLDSGNGTAGIVAPKLLKKLGCEVIELFSEPDGRFPNHHPDPTVPKNLKTLSETVVKEQADFGAAYDGDADRIGVVDEAGNIVWGDKLMVIFSRAILAKNPGATIVGEVKSSQTMYDEIKRLGGVPVMWKTGHSLIKARMKELKAAFAGEMSGHIFFADRWFGFDDAIYSSCRLAEIMAEKRAGDADFAFSALLKGVPDTFVTPEIRIDCPDKLKFEAIERLDKAVGKGMGDFKIRDIIRIDGLRINFDGGWALVRASNTQPVLVLRFEAESETLLEKAKGFIKEKFSEACPEIRVGI